MSDMNRRDFLVTAATTVAVISLPVLQSHSDAAPPSGPIDVGPLKGFDKDGVTDTWAKKPAGAFFIIRQDGKLFAPSSLCTHKGCVLLDQPPELYCKCHHSHFTIQGAVISGRAKVALPRYAVSVDANGHVVVDKTREFPEAQWDAAGSFIVIDKAT
jgi:Rieske Fe-S protein